MSQPLNCNSYALLRGGWQLVRLSIAVLLACQVASSLKGVAQVGAVNCEEHKQLCAQHGVKGYPTIKVFLPGQKEGKLYQGER